MLASSKRNFFLPKIISTRCAFGINISDKKTIRPSPNCVGRDVKPYPLTYSPVTHYWTLCSHAADDRGNLSWLVGIGKPGMPFPCSDATVFTMHDGFYKKKCCSQVREKKKTSPTLNSQRLASAITKLERRSSLQPIATDCRPASCAFRLPARYTRRNKFSCRTTQMRR